MNTIQLSQAVLNDSSIYWDLLALRDRWLAGHSNDFLRIQLADMCRAEAAKNIYEGFSFDSESLYEAADFVLQDLLLTYELNASVDDTYDDFGVNTKNSFNSEKRAK
jgi:hypothetical protein